MLCPLKKSEYIEDRYNTGHSYLTDCDCDENSCAWWDTKKGQCCIKTLSELKISGMINNAPIK
jgi:hypothetical protein